MLVMSTVQGVFVFVTLATIIVLSPFPVWGNLFRLIYFTTTSTKISRKLRFRLVLYIMYSALALCVKSIFWQLDKILFSKVPTNDLVMIIGSPRSGTTFLHRILGQNDAFHTLTYLQMRFPSEFLWKLFDLFGITEIISQKNYWPNTDNGRLASKLHKHTWGDKEEIGMFLEEIMFSHFFLYRRFPFPPVARDIADLNKLSESQWSRLVKGIDGLIQRSIHHNRVQDKKILLKENESASLLRKMAAVHPGMKFIFIYRPTDEIAASYQNLSLTSTQAKTEVDPRCISGWQEANNEYRAREMQELVEFYKELPEENKYLVGYDMVTSNLEEEIYEILRWLDVTSDGKYAEFLKSEKVKQKMRDKGYSNEDYTIGSIEQYDKFFESVLHSKKSG